MELISAYLNLRTRSPGEFITSYDDLCNDEHSHIAALIPEATRKIRILTDRLVNFVSEHSGEFIVVVTSSAIQARLLHDVCRVILRHCGISCMNHLDHEFGEIRTAFGANIVFCTMNSLPRPGYVCSYLFVDDASLIPANNTDILFSMVVLNGRIFMIGSSPVSDEIFSNSVLNHIFTRGDAHLWHKYNISASDLSDSMRSTRRMDGGD